MNLNFETKPDLDVPSTFSQNSPSWYVVAQYCIQILNQRCSNLPPDALRRLPVYKGRKDIFSCVFFLIYIQYENMFFYFSTWAFILLQKCFAPSSWQDSKGLISAVIKWLPFPYSALLDCLQFCTAGIDKRLMFSLGSILKIVSSLILQNNS